jgi:hypothetical protein
MTTMKNKEIEVAVHKFIDSDLYKEFILSMDKLSDGKTSVEIAACLSSGLDMVINSMVDENTKESVIQFKDKLHQFAITSIYSLYKNEVKQ